jgi:hypothetical protein
MATVCPPRNGWVIFENIADFRYNGQGEALPGQAGFAADSQKNVPKVNLSRAAGESPIH